MWDIWGRRIGEVPKLETREPCHSNCQRTQAALTDSCAALGTPVPTYQLKAITPAVKLRKYNRPDCTFVTITKELVAWRPELPASIRPMEKSRETLVPPAEQFAEKVEACGVFGRASLQAGVSALYFRFASRL